MELRHMPAEPEKGINLCHANGFPGTFGISERHIALLPYF